MNVDRSSNQELVGNRRSRYWQTAPIRWLGRVCLVVLCCVVVVLGGSQLQATSAREFAGPADAPDFAHRLLAAADEAFADSASVGDRGPATPGREELPSSPVAGLTTVTAAGPVQLVLPDGLGEALSTADGVVVYPDRGAGLDMLAERTGSGVRTVARILSPEGVRMVTTFVRTPADTVMLAHTNGYLTINRATPTAETIGMFAPAETRDSAGKLVPSSYVVRQLSAGLYQLSEVIDPEPDTVWPVYADPPLSITGPGGASLPQFGFSDLTGAISGAANAVGDAVSTAVSATVSGAQAVGTFVKNNPLETAIIVAGAAVAVTGVGGPAGAAAIAAAVANVGAAGLEVAAQAMPDNKTLGVISTIANAATMITPSGAGKKIAQESAELAEKFLTTHADDIIDVAKTAPTPPAQLSDEIASAATTPKAPLAETPKAANAPPAPGEGPYGPRSLPKGCTLDCGHTLEHPAAVYDQREMPGHYDANLNSITNNEKPAVVTRTNPQQRDINRRAATGHLPSAGPDRVKHEYPYASTREGGRGADVSNQPRSESNIEGDLLRNVYQRQGVKQGDQFTTVYRGQDGQTRCTQCATARRQQAAQQQESTNNQRYNAFRDASSKNSDGRRQPGQQSSHRSGDSKPHRTQRNAKKPKKQSNSHKRRKGQK